MQNSGEELVKILDNNLNYILQEDGYANIEEIPANDMVVLEIMATVSQSDLQQVESVALITDSNENTYRSNKLISKLEQAKVELSLTSPTAGQYVNIGDYIIYNITVENPTNCVEDVEISNQLSEYLVVEEVYINGELTIQSINPEDTETYLQDILNETTYTLIIEENQKSEISIKARVNEITEDFDKITITNTAQATVKGEVKTTSEEITHTIVRQASESEEKIISGVAWLDENQDGQKDTNEKLLQDITVRLLDTETNQLAIDKEGNVLETTTGEDGTYKFSKVQEGIYIVVFDYDTTKYEPTIYMKDGVSTGLNSKALAKVFDGEVKGNAGTDIIYLTENLYDINLGLKQNLKFDLELGKYINTIVVQNAKGTKTYECKDNETLKKIEINSKQIEGSVVVLEYKIKVKNTGEIAGYVTNIRDYLPNGLTFSSELNPNWYLSGKDLYTKSLANTRIEPGEEKEINLILTKTMTSDNVGLINNRAEIAENYNELGKQDIDSTANNQSSEEDDMGAADVIIGISTGMKTAISTILMTLNICLIGFAIYLISRKSSEIN